MIILRAEADQGTTGQHGFGVAIRLVEAIKKGNRGILVSARATYRGAIVTRQGVALVIVTAH